jgi:hypothetical protein
MRAATHACTALHARVVHRRSSRTRITQLTSATDGGDAQTSSSTFTLLPKDASDGLKRYRAVLGPLFLAGGALHVPDLFGAGLISQQCGVESFGELSLALQALTALWAFGGPVTAFGLFTGSFAGDVGITAIASTEIILGIDFPAVIAPADLPTPIIAAQIVNLVSLVGLRGWETVEKKNAAREG